MSSGRLTQVDARRRLAPFSSIAGSIAGSIADSIAAADCGSTPAWYAVPTRRKFAGMAAQTDDADLRRSQLQHQHLARDGIDILTVPIPIIDSDHPELTGEHSAQQNDPGHVDHVMAQPVRNRLRRDEPFLRRPT
jgi:hypothetical protein